MAKVRQNLAWAFGYNLLVLPIAAGVLLPGFGVLLSPPLAALLMALSSITVVVNALLLGRDGWRRGRLFVLEGIDGCGKSTQIEHLRHWLPASGLMPVGANLLVTREPGGTELGRALRQLLLHPPGAAEPCSTAELLLYAADRAQHVQQMILPALEAGHWVLSDRFCGSTAAYQGYGRGLSLELIDQLSRIACRGWTRPHRAA